MKTIPPTNVPHTSGRTETDDTTVKKVAQSAREIVDKMAGAATDVARGAIPTIDRAAEFAHKAVDNAATGASSAADWLDGRAHELDATQEKLLADARTYIAQNPLKAVGAALAVGFLLARIIR